MLTELYAQAKDLIRYLFSADWFKYLFVGGSTVVLDLGGLILLHGVIGINAIVAATITYWISVFYNFSLNRYWTFGAKDGKLHHHAAKYGVLLAVNYVVTIGFIAGLGHFGVNYAVAKVMSVLVSMTWTYFAYKKLIFV